MIIEKKYIKNMLYINLKGILNKSSIKVLEDELYIIIYKIGIINISININNVLLEEKLDYLLNKFKTKLLLKGGNLYVVGGHLNNFYIYQNEYQVFKLSNFI